MGKVARKQIVYLDQNFLSEMAKGGAGKKVKPEFGRLYELLHQGFIDEKIMVPRSHFHDIDTSLIPNLRERIRAYQGYLGQIALKDRSLVQTYQLQNAIERFREVEPSGFGYKIIFREDPDKRTERFSIRGNIDWGFVDWKSIRNTTASNMNTLRDNLRTNGVSFSDQQMEEFKAQDKFVLKEYGSQIWSALGSDSASIKAFVSSGEIRRMPSVALYVTMWSKLLTDYSSRSIKVSDDTDIMVLSTYLPYVDVIATDTFMATLIRDLHLDSKYGTSVFGAKDRDLIEFETQIESVLITTNSVNIPELSIFVIPTQEIKSNSWEFFRALGNSARRHESRYGGWVEVFAFDDGDMPKYPSERIGGTFPFYGLQDVSTIELPTDTSTASIDLLCRQRSPARVIAVVNMYSILTEDFVTNVLRWAEAGQGYCQGLRLVSNE